MNKKEPFGLFITGTDTEIGKTLVASALVYNFAERGLTSIGMKPVAAGANLKEGTWRNDDVQSLKDASNIKDESLAPLVNPYLFCAPIAPHIAAQQTGQRIEVSKVLASYHELTRHADAIVVEGVGGFQVPFNEDEDSADMAQQLNLPVIMVVGMRLGCINHALLTAEAIAARGLSLVGWVANSVQSEMPHLSENIDALCERLSKRFHAALLGRIPHLAAPTTSAAAQYIDMDAVGAINKE